MLWVGRISCKQVKFHTSEVAFLSFVAALCASLKLLLEVDGPAEISKNVVLKGLPRMHRERVRCHGALAAPAHRERMPLSVPPSRVFAELVCPSDGEGGPAGVAGGGGGGGCPAAPGREVHVSGSAELSARPDRARVTVHLSSRKAEAGAARSSVTRRLDYVAQAARQRGAISEDNVTVTKHFSRIDNAYNMEAEVCIIFSDFGKMQDVCNFLVEKLDSSVIISPPHFYHTMETIDVLRRQVCLAAVGSARQKAQEVCVLFGQSLGKPLLIREEEVKEWDGHLENPTSESQSLQQKLQNATIYVSSRIFAVFEIKGGKKRKYPALLNVN